MSNVESVETIYDAFGRGDVDAILDQLADDVEWDLDAPGYRIPIYEPVTRFFHCIDRHAFVLAYGLTSTPRRPPPVTLGF